MRRHEPAWQRYRAYFSRPQIPLFRLEWKGLVIVLGPSFRGMVVGLAVIAAHSNVSMGTVGAFLCGAGLALGAEWFRQVVAQRAKKAE